jgi:DNA-binding LacI/PurR family transcriptional regulator
VNFPKYGLGRESCRVLIDRVANPERPLEFVELRSTLSIRESCGFQLRRGATAIA